MKTILITGAAGFIGSTLAQELLKKKCTIIGIDNLANNYDPKFKKDNLLTLEKFNNFNFHKIDILKVNLLEKIFSKYHPQIVIHLAALTGIRTSIEKPKLYEKVNIIGTKNVYNLTNKYRVQKFIFSSSSSVYGNSKNIPFIETQRLFPRSPYAKTKKEAEILLKKMFSKYKIPTFILRFFSVYGPKGRPDMAPYLFTESAFNKKPIKQYGDGNSARDYTYIDDVIDAIVKLIYINQINWEILNIGNSSPIKLIKLITKIENITELKINRLILSVNKSESVITYANIQKAKNKLNWKPKVSFDQGMEQFIKWYKKTRL